LESGGFKLWVNSGFNLYKAPTVAGHALTLSSGHCDIFATAAAAAVAEGLAPCSQYLISCVVVLVKRLYNSAGIRLKHAWRSVSK
jgi:hypothetical protein